MATGHELDGTDSSAGRSNRLDTVAHVAEQVEVAQAHARAVRKATRALTRTVADQAGGLADTYDATAALLEEGAGLCADESRRALLDRAREARRRATHERDQARRLQRPRSAAET
ncbi:hypothetical protein [Actinomycetospora sp. TBRC 11914]|uniref:hypothetical protein n=1 Tax=Actinomycetospora sp. TBRC 11914 TaxID=2729387 RepID=UPI00145C8422|nr:hypothetical protein [Actinomycetospora sp. TBRC 11914]NMO94074.1 hypothetical protein [Actinomycetospora sp. TBRC 11914]